MREVDHLTVRKRGQVMYKVTKFIYDKCGVFINPITIKPKFIYLTMKAKLNNEREGK